LSGCELLVCRGCDHSPVQFLDCARHHLVAGHSRQLTDLENLDARLEFEAVDVDRAVHADDGSIVGADCDRPKISSRYLGLRNATSLVASSSIRIGTIAWSAVSCDRLQHLSDVGGESLVARFGRGKLLLHVDEPFGNGHLELRQALGNFVDRVPHRSVLDDDGSIVWGG
jgi:hypothetical protein